MADSTSFRLVGRSLTLARAFWVVLALPIIGILVLAAVGERPAVAAFADLGWTPDAYRAALSQLGLPDGSLDLFFTLSANLVRLSFVGVCLVLFRRPGDGMAYFTSLTLLTFSVTVGGVPNLPQGGPVLDAFVTFVQAFGQGCLLLFIFIFPNGRFVPGWMRWPTLAAVLGLTVLARLPVAQFRPVVVAFLWLSTLWVLVSTLPAQIYRYRRVSTPIERQQTKLVVFGIAAFLIGAAGGWLAAGFILPALAPAAVPVPGTGARLLYDFGFNEFRVLAALPLPLTLGVAILRYRLWDIDVIIRRTLVYALLTGLLALAYFGSVVVLQNVFSALTGQRESTLVTVLSTLVIAALFVPLRARVQAVIDRRLYRRKYDAARTVAAFGATLRDETNIEVLTDQLVDVVHGAMQPASVDVWLASNQRDAASRPAAYDREQP